MREQAIDSIVEYLEQERVGTESCVNGVAGLLKDAVSDEVVIEPRVVASQLSEPEPMVVVVLRGFQDRGLLDSHQMLRCRKCQLLAPLAGVEDAAAEGDGYECEGYECGAELTELLDDEPVTVFRLIG